MKRAFLVMAAALLMAVGAKAQEAKNSGYRQGYKFDVAVNYAMKYCPSVSTTHGYNFGNGMFVGGGVEFAAEWHDNYEGNPHFLTPVFAEGKYTILNTLASPYVALRAGAVVDITDKNVRGLLNPRVGLDLWNFLLGIGYQWHLFNGNRNGINFQIAYNF